MKRLVIFFDLVELAVADYFSYFVKYGIVYLDLLGDGLQVWCAVVILFGLAQLSLSVFFTAEFNLASPSGKAVSGSVTEPYQLAFRH